MVYYGSSITYCQDPLYFQFISPLLDLISPMVTSHMIIYDGAYNASFHQKLDSIKYKAALAKTGAIRVTSKKKLYDDLGLEKRRWYRKLCCFFRICRYKCPEYLFDIVPTSVSTYNTRNTKIIPLFKVKHSFF